MATLPKTSDASPPQSAAPSGPVRPPPPLYLGEKPAAVAPSPAARAKSEAEQAKPSPTNPPRGKIQLPSAAHWLSTTLRHGLRETPAWLASVVIHAAVLILLGLIYIEPPPPPNEVAVASTPELPNDSLEDLGTPDAGSDMLSIEDALNRLDGAGLNDIPLNPLADDADAAPGGLDLSSLSSSLVNTEDLLKTTGGSGIPGAPGGLGEGLGSRTGNLKSELIKKGGGTDASEAAVGKALRWLSAHQLPDGSWNFNLEKCPNCRGNCKNSGDGEKAKLGATALGLLPFLGAGQTHRQGQYKEVVRKGIYYLTTHTKDSGGYMSMNEPEGTMYSHGLATIALCEAYAMTNDRSMAPFAQGAVNYIIYAQDPVGGGWRYQPRTEGDTSVVGWQLMALKSAQMAGLEVPSSAFTRTTKFLNSVDGQDGATYGYMRPATDFPRATSSVGLLCRMYLGWTKDNPALQRGISLIAREGPSLPARTNNRADMYYNYYATQVLRHWGGYEFDQWNRKMRDFLVDNQSRDGHEAGSWFFSFESHSAVGGRLYCTSMAAMILEVYYRHLPLYGNKAVADEFAR